MVFSVGTEALSDGTVVVSIEGELDLYTAPDFERELFAAIGTGAERVVVDLRKCEFCDSTALAVLLGARKALNDRGELVVVANRSDILRVFQITGLDQILRIERALPSTRQLRAVGG